MTDKVQTASHWLYAPPDLGDYDECAAEVNRLRRTIAVLIAITLVTEDKAWAAYDVASHD